ncbi:hypothetical protein EHYA_06990 [Embleya hyalina]|uniref:Uncharacterized protein n=1 Tax=Embleya hyalina TaxID=516124 RepID=A0A401YXD5_9ACTN|nr:hypothetical protein EHYA_06990 [Embleya hyalina]
MGRFGRGGGRHVPALGPDIGVGSPLPGGRRRHARSSPPWNSRVRSGGRGRRSRSRSARRRPGTRRTRRGRGGRGGTARGGPRTHPPVAARRAGTAPDGSTPPPADGLHRPRRDRRSSPPTRATAHARARSGGTARPLGTPDGTDRDHIADSAGPARAGRTAAFPAGRALSAGGPDRTVRPAERRATVDIHAVSGQRSRIDPRGRSVRNSRSADTRSAHGPRHRPGRVRRRQRRARRVHGRPRRASRADHAGHRAGQAGRFDRAQAVRGGQHAEGVRAQAQPPPPHLPEDERRTARPRRERRRFARRIRRGLGAHQDAYRRIGGQFGRRPPGEPRMHTVGNAHRARGQPPNQLRGQRMAQIRARTVSGHREHRPHRRRIQQDHIGPDQPDHDRQRHTPGRLGCPQVGHRGRPHQGVVRVHHPGIRDLRRLDRREPYRHALARQHHRPRPHPRRPGRAQRPRGAFEGLRRAQMPGQHRDPAAIPPPGDERRGERPPGRRHLVSEPAEQAAWTRPSGQHPQQHRDEDHEFEQGEPAHAPVAAPEVRAERIGGRRAADRALPLNR